jgi:ZIP family zinc transporter
LNDFLLVLAIACTAATLTYLGAPAAERFEVSHSVVSAALQFAAGIIAALVAFSLMPPAVRDGPPLPVVVAFFAGGALFVIVEYYFAQRRVSEDPAAVKPPSSEPPSSELPSSEPPVSLGFYFGVLLDLVVDGVVIGVGSSLTLQTGLLLALGMAISTVPLAFVTIATAKRQGMSEDRRRLLGILFFGCIIGGTILGYALLRDQPEPVKLTLLALASGFLITMVTQSMIPEANREGEPSFAGILFVGGLSVYALLKLAF